MAGEPIDISDVRVGDVVRVTNAYETHEGTVERIDDLGDGWWNVKLGKLEFGERARRAEPFHRFVLLERPKVKAARALAELAVTKTQVPHDILRREIAPMLGLTKKGGRRGRKTRRKTRKSRK